MKRLPDPRLSSMPVLAPVAALAAVAVIMSQAVTFAVIFLGPEPRPAGFTVGAAGEALEGHPATTSDGRPLTRRLSGTPVVVPEMERHDPLATAIAATLGQRLGVTPDRLRVRIERRGPPHAFGAPHRPDGPGQGFEGPQDGHAIMMFQTRHGPNDVPPPDLLSPDGPTPGGGRSEGRSEGRPPPVGSMSATIQTRTVTHGGGTGIDTTSRQLTVLADRITFDPFSVSLSLPDGRWATVEPPRDLISPWQMRLLISLLISMTILAPIVWLLARRLTQPIRAFATAADRLGADPDADPMDLAGPAEVRTAILAFNGMQASLREHMSRRTQTIAAIAHDLRTPLTRLRFRAEQTTEPLRERMVADVEEMDALIGQAMAFVRGETQADRRETLDLQALAGTCATGFSETGAAVTYGGGPALIVEGDPAGLKRAVANLIENALKFAGSARVAARIEDGQAVVRIEDDGPGLAEEELEAVFEPFARGERSRSRQTGGAGLGLAVARQAARAAGGDVTLANRTPSKGLSRGLVAILSLPLKGRA